MDRIELHVRVAFSSSGTPFHAELEIVREESAAPLLYVDWKPKLIQALVAPECRRE